MVIQENYCFMVEQNNKTATSSTKIHLINHGISAETINSKRKTTTKNYLPNPAATARTLASIDYTSTRRLALVCALDQTPFNICYKKGFRLF
jgi:hypothetical protein